MARSGPTKSMFRSEYHQYSFGPARRPRRIHVAMPVGGFRKGRRDRRNERWLVLVRPSRCSGDDRGLRGGRDPMSSTLVNVPARAKRGEIIAIKTLISRVMET